ncbi:MAG: diguanylate cyclase [Clostridia bacterium]|nr:diguanylate cyclase [Clostridia bacterium]
MRNNNVLVVDDSKVDRLIIMKTLESANYDINVIESDDGIDIIEKIKLNEIKVVILDIMIGDIDGIEILKQIKADQQICDTPVIMCSSLHDSYSITQSLENGAYDYFEKPISNKTLKITLALKIKNALDVRFRLDHMKYLQEYDSLTGLLSRKSIESEIQKYSERGHILTVVILDINGLRILNDAYGHDVGDKIIREVSDAVRCVSDGYLCSGRWGSDEIIVLLPFSVQKSIAKFIERVKEQIDSTRKNDYGITFGWATSRHNEPFDRLTQNAEENLYSNKILEKSNVRRLMIDSIMNTLHQKNPREEKHSVRVSMISEALSKELGFSDYEVKRITLAALMHDVGKIVVDEKILNKPGKLSEEEWISIKRHPEIGFKILSTSTDTIDIANSVLVHHERWDGKGYPKGIKEKEIPIAARIIAVADAYDAMTAYRTYRERLSSEEAVQEIVRCSGTQFDPLVVDAFIKVSESKKIDQEMVSIHENQNLINEEQLQSVMI